MPVTDVQQDLDNLTLTITADFAAPVQRIWQVYADPRQLEKVWGPPTYPATVVDHDLRAGGRITFFMAGTEGERHDFDLAGWDELRRLDPRTVTIGSHTLSHPILTSLDAREMEVEVAQSRRLLATRLQRAVDLFAYPNGGLDPAVHECVRRNYRGAVCSEEGWVGPLCDLHLLPRVSASLSPLKLAKILHRPMPQPLAPGLRPIFA